VGTAQPSPLEYLSCLAGEVSLNDLLGGETMAYKITDACIACGVCKDECPVNCISEGDIYVIDEAVCIDCDACAGVCPVDACVSA